MNVEGQDLEFKRSVKNFKEIGKTACAFANAFGGRIIIGVADDGEVVGVPDDAIDILQQRLEGAMQQVSPVPFHKITVEEKEGKRTIVVEVSQAGQGTFCTHDGIVYHRTGSVNTKLGGRTLQAYLMDRYILSFDESRSQAGLGDIDPNRLKDFLVRRTPDLRFDKRRMKAYLLSLNLAETLIALGISSTTNPLAVESMKQLPKLSSCELHLTHLPTPGDEKGLRRLGVNLTSDPKFATNKLFVS